MTYKLLNFRKHSKRTALILVIATLIALILILWKAFTGTVLQSAAAAVITSKKGYSSSIGEDFCWIIEVTVRNEGEPGPVIITAHVQYEYYHASFTDSRTVYLGFNESTHLMFVFPAVVPQPCSDRHSIQWLVDVWPLKTFVS